MDSERNLPRSESRTMILDSSYVNRFPVEDLQEHPENPRRGDVDVIGRSIDANGFYGAVLVQTSTRRVIAGNHRLRAAKDRGFTEIPVLFLDVDDDQARRILLVDNRTNDVATYDDEVLASLLRDLEQSARGFDGTGYEPADLTKILDEIERREFDPTDPTEEISSAPALTRPGDRWTLGPHVLICGSSHHPEVWDGVEANLVVTSPPYARQRSYDRDTEFEPIPADGYVDWIRPVVKNIETHLVPDGSFLLNLRQTFDDLDGEVYVFDLVVTMVRRWGWHFGAEYVWDRTMMPINPLRRLKNCAEPVYQFARNDWKFRPEHVRHESDLVPVRGTSRYSSDPNRWQGTGRNAVQGRDLGPGLAYPSNRIPSFTGSHDATGHPAAFPVGLPAYLTRLYTDRGDLVVDPFAGSGSTILGAHTTGRRGYGIEISPKYVDIACRRFEEATGIVPRRDGDEVSFIATETVQA